MSSGLITYDPYVLIRCSRDRGETMNKIVCAVKKRRREGVISDLIALSPNPSPKEPSVVLALAIAVIIDSMFRGWDYLFLPQHAQYLTAIEEAAPIKLWGIGFVIGAFHCAFGRAVRRHSIVIIGHGILASLYFSLGCGYIQQGVHDVSSDYLRNGVALIFVVSAVHGVFTYATWRRWDSDRRLRA